MESNTLPAKPRKIMNWVWLVMMVLAFVVAIGNAVFG
jgi:hypothetical protein